MKRYESDQFDGTDLQIESGLILYVDAWATIGLFSFAYDSNSLKLISSYGPVSTTKDNSNSINFYAPQNGHIVHVQNNTSRHRPGVMIICIGYGVV